jgi:formyltetrahydrofolate synthetase
VKSSLHTMESDDIMRVSEADREILERVLNVRRILNLEDVMQLLRSEVKRAGSQRAFARKAGVNISVVSKNCAVRYCSRDAQTLNKSSGSLACYNRFVRWRRIG